MSNLLFCFDSYETAENTLELNYSYKDGDVIVGKFKEKYHLPLKLMSDDPTQAFILRQILIVCGVSYYKSLLGEVHLPFDLSANEADYWNTVYREGLGEFSYVNNITAPINPFSHTIKDSVQATDLATNGALLGIGGGKDSIVAGEILRELHIPTQTFHLSTQKHSGQASSVMDIMGFKQLNIERYVDTTISTFTKENVGFNGHIPISAIIAWLGILLAYNIRSQYVVVANESASSEGNVEWQGRIINHQWSKSLTFEQMTQDYVHTHVSPDITYMSLIRPFSSLKVTKLLNKIGEPYLGDFTSCNLVLRINPEERPRSQWCGKCAKCLSSYLLLTAWLPVNYINRLFEKDMLSDESLQPLLQELLGLSGHKPLDCVGTTDELRAVTRKLLDSTDDLPLLKQIDPIALSGKSIEELTSKLEPHALPEDIASKITSL